MRSPFFQIKRTAANFDPVKHFDTLPELINQKFNRPRVETLEQERAIAPEDDMIIKVNHNCTIYIVEISLSI